MVGESLLHYRVVSSLGQGGMGAVYLALDTNLGRTVALKVLKPGTNSATSRLRFLREARAAAALNHPNIISIFEIGSERDIDFIAMELVEGQTIAAILKQGQMRVAQAVDFAAQIASALAVAHAAGVVHRDLKPANAMVTSRGLVKLLDFGLAQVHHDAPAGGESPHETTSSLTVEGAVVGSFPYMSPEQARGETLDNRSDIFSFGIMLYEMLAGARPFAGASPVELLHRTISEAPPPLQIVRPGLPPALITLVNRCLEKAPAARFQTMEPVREALADIARRLDSVAQEDTQTGSIVSPQFLKPTGPPTRRWWIAGAAASAAGAVGVGSWKGWEFLHKTEGRLIAVLPFQTFTDDRELRAFSDGMAEMLTSKLTQIEQLQRVFEVVPASEIRGRKIDSVDRARQQYNVNLAVTGSIQRLDKTMQFTANLIDAVHLKQLRSSSFDADEGDLKALRDGVISRVVGMLDLQITPQSEQALDLKETDRAKAYFAYLEGRGYLYRFDVEGNVDRAIQSLGRALAEDPNYALAHAGLGEAYWRKSRQTGAKEWADKAVESALKAVQLGGKLAIPHVKLGEIYAGTGRPQEAIQEFKAALEAEPGNSEAYRGLGRAYNSIGLLKEAEKAYLDAVRLRPNDWYAYNLLGVFYNSHGKSEQAIQAFIQARDRTPDNEYPYRNLGFIYLSLGRFPEARTQLEKSLQIKSSFLGHIGMGTLAYYGNAPKEAVAEYKAATRIEERNHLGWGHLGNAYAQIPGSSREANTAYAKAIASCEDQLKINPKDEETRAYLASYYAKMGQKEKALETLSHLADWQTLDLNARFVVALAHEVAGERSMAVKEFESVLQDGYSVAEIRYEPALRQLTSDAAFAPILKRYVR